MITPNPMQHCDRSTHSIGIVQIVKLEFPNVEWKEEECTESCVLAHVSLVTMRLWYEQTRFKRALLSSTESDIRFVRNDSLSLSISLSVCCVFVAPNAWFFLICLSNLLAFRQRSALKQLHTHIISSSLPPYNRNTQISHTNRILNEWTTNKPVMFNFRPINICVIAKCHRMNVKLWSEAVENETKIQGILERAKEIKTTNERGFIKVRIICQCERRRSSKKMSYESWKRSLKTR